MKIGILTFHRSVNNGAVLQCFALASRIQKDFPENYVEVIDYDMPRVSESIYPDTLTKYYAGANVRVLLSKTKRLLLDPMLLKRQKEKNSTFQKAIGRLPLSVRRIVNNDTEELFSYINESYDAVIVGSDAIWNYSIRGFPNPYFLSTSIDIPKFSYAASCYGMIFEEIPDAQKRQIASILNSYAFIGTRDSEAVNFLSHIHCIKKPVHTCDPTLLLDMDDLPVNLVRLKDKLTDRRFSFNKKTIGVMGTEEMCRMVKSLYGDKYQIVALFNYCKSADVNLFDLDPYEWAYSFRYFSLTFTTYFHGTLLSLKNGTPVICIALENAYNRTHVAKVYDFLQRVNMSDCYFTTDYKTLNLKEIKVRADKLLNNEEYSVFINRNLDREGLSYENFKVALKSRLSETKQD